MSRYQLLPPLSEDEYAALRDDIRSAGVRIPIDVDESGAILDGHHRKAIADELGVECPERVVRGLPEFAKVDYALSVNLTRRHLGADQKKALVVKSLKRDPRLSNREHARRCAVSHAFVATLREALVLDEQIEAIAARTGRDGKAYPADRSPQVDVASTSTPESDRTDASGEAATAGPSVASPEVPANTPGPAETSTAGATGAGPVPAPVADTTDPGVAAPAGSEPSSPEPGPFAAGGEREEASTRTPDGAASRVSPAPWTAEERKAHEEEVQVRKDIESAYAFAKTFVTAVRNQCFTILVGYRLGERDLVTAEQIADCRRALDLLEKEVIADAQR